LPSRKKDTWIWQGLKNHRTTAVFTLNSDVKKIHTRQKKRYPDKKRGPRVSNVAEDPMRAGGKKNR